MNNLHAKAYVVYPNQQAHVQGDALSRGVVRNGVVEENDDTLKMGIADKLAMVTWEGMGMVRCYMQMAHNGATVLVGPYTLHSEEVI